MTFDPSTIGRIWLVGCGNMGGALLARWLAGGLTDIVVIDPQARDLPGGIAARARVPTGAPPAIVVLAVKPQAWHDVVAGWAPQDIGDATIVSVMAGIDTDALTTRFPDRPVIRTMPNTPARIGRGITALFSTTAPPVERETVAALMSYAGDVVWLDEEADFDAVTAVSGSGPAYVFAFIESLSAAGQAAGLSPALAARMALGTVGGAAALAMHGEATPEALRIAVTSPNGTTAAGLAVLRPALDPLLRETVAAAQSRSRDLGRTR